MPRIPIAKAGEVPPKCERQLHFWFWYDWDSTEKAIGLSNTTPPPMESQWQRVYICSMTLPVPVEHDGRAEIELEATAYDGQDYNHLPEQLAHWVARRLFGMAGRAASAPMSISWIGSPFDMATNSFVMATDQGRRLRVTVEDLDADAP